MKKRNKNNTQVKIIVINSNNNGKWMILRICSDCTLYCHRQTFCQNKTPK